MAFKDKDKQREAVKQATRRYRPKVSPKVSPKQGITMGVTAIRDKAIEQSTASAQEAGPVRLPAGVPEHVRDRYARGESDYNKVIDRLLANPIEKLKIDNVWIPGWRYGMDVENKK